MSFDYDLFVIGGGSGGVRAARVAAAEGVKGRAGRGRPLWRHLCDPWLCAQKADGLCLRVFAGMVEDAQAYGWDIQSGRFQTGTISRGKLHAELDRLEGIYRNLLRNSGVESFDQRAKMVDAAYGGAGRWHAEDRQAHVWSQWAVVRSGRTLPGAELGISSNEIFPPRQTAGEHPDRRRRLHRV